LFAAVAVQQGCPPCFSSHKEVRRGRLQDSGSDAGAR